MKKINKYHSSQKMKRIKNKSDEVKVEIEGRECWKKYFSYYIGMLVILNSRIEMNKY